MKDMVFSLSKEEKVKRFVDSWENAWNCIEASHKQGKTDLKNAFKSRKFPPINPFGSFSSIIRDSSSKAGMRIPSNCFESPCLPLNCESSSDKEVLLPLVSNLYSMDSPQRLRVLFKLFRLLDSIMFFFSKDNTFPVFQSDSVEIDALIAFARRIRCHVRAPPEYNDPTGLDAFCVPNYFFPCPDRLTMSRSALYFSNRLRAAPPVISFQQVPNDALSYKVPIADADVNIFVAKVVIECSTPNASIFYAVDNSGHWTLYHSSSKPSLSGEGIYVVQAYSHAEGYFSSEISVADLEIVKLKENVSSDVLQSSSVLVEPASPRTGASEPLKSTSRDTSTLQSLIKFSAPRINPSSSSLTGTTNSFPKFGSLFLNEDSESDDDNSNDKGFVEENKLLLISSTRFFWIDMLSSLGRLTIV